MSCWRSSVLRMRDSWLGHLNQWLRSIELGQSSHKQGIQSHHRRKEQSISMHIRFDRLCMMSSNVWLGGLLECLKIAHIGYIYQFSMVHNLRNAKPNHNHRLMDLLDHSHQLFPSLHAIQPKRIHSYRHHNKYCHEQESHNYHKRFTHILFHRLSKPILQHILRIETHFHLD